MVYKLMDLRLASLSLKHIFFEARVILPIKISFI